MRLLVCDCLVLHQSSRPFLLFSRALYIKRCDWMVFAVQGGAAIYAQRIPERWYPGRFDYFLSSHQIFHGGLRPARGGKNRCFMVGDGLLDLNITDVAWWVTACSI